TGDLLLQVTGVASVLPGTVGSNAAAFVNADWLLGHAPRHPDERPHIGEARGGWGPARDAPPRRRPGGRPGPAGPIAGAAAAARGGGRRGRPGHRRGPAPPCASERAARARGAR